MADCEIPKFELVNQDNLKISNEDYKGKVYPINPKQESILGIKCYPSLDAINLSIEVLAAT